MGNATFRAAGTVVDSASSSNVTTPTITVPATVIAADYCLLIVSWVGASGEDPGTYTPSGGSWSTVLAPGTYANMGFALYQKTGLTAADTFTVTGSVARLYTVGHVYYSSTTGYTSVVGAVTSRGGVSLTTTTAAAITTTEAGGTVLIVSVERTTATGTTISSVSPAATQRTFGEGTGTSTNTVYAGEFTGASPAGLTSARTITYNTASGNGAAVQLAAMSAGTAVTAAASSTLTASLSAAASVDRKAAASASWAASLTATAAVDRKAAASSTLTASLSAAATVDRAAVATLPLTALFSATADVVASGNPAGTLPLAVMFSAEAEVLARTSGSGGWQSLISIRDELRSWQAEEQSPPVACPIDGEPLQTGPEGQLFCPFDGWRYRG